MPAARDLDVLVVDDQKAIRALVRSCLQEMGISKVTEAEDGLHALEILSRTRKHLILSDLNMPNLDGIGLLRAVRKNPETAKIAFIMITSLADTELVRQAAALGVNNYIIKPFTMDSMRRKITAVFGQLT